MTHRSDSLEKRRGKSGLQICRVPRATRLILERRFRYSMKIDKLETPSSPAAAAKDGPQNGNATAPETLKKTGESRNLSDVITSNNGDHVTTALGVLDQGSEVNGPCFIGFWR